MELKRLFPGLSRSPYGVSSPTTPLYNCIAWAAQCDDRWWWPDAMGQYYWPADVNREETLQAFENAYGTLGFSSCENAKIESGFEKVAVYAKDGVPTHAARQLPDGRWTSKLGVLEDIEHDTPAGLEGEHYGRVSLLLKRPVAEPAKPR